MKKHGQLNRLSPQIVFPRLRNPSVSKELEKVITFAAHTQ